MPIYEYICSGCETVEELLQKLDSPPPERCNNCGKSGTMNKTISHSSFALKGDGWYKDLYASPKKPEPSDKSNK